MRGWGYGVLVGVDLCGDSCPMLDGLLVLLVLLVLLI